MNTSRAIPDKADLAAVLRAATPDKLKTIQHLLKAGLPKPNMYIDIYKNRRSQFKRARLWIYADLGTCRFEDLFLTDEWGQQLPISILRAGFPENIPNITEIIQCNNQQENQASQTILSTSTIKTPLNITL
jgi:hypothetical protein